jgi:hypothetical protein
MAGPEFRWIRHRLSVPAGSPVLGLASAVLEAPPPAAAAPAGAAAQVTAYIDLPDLSEWPSPLAKADILLQKAAQIEHALMVQYLYATYSLKAPTEVTDPQQSASLTTWRRVLPQIAKEEMAHLLTVENLRLALDRRPTLERDNFPILEKIYPFTMHLEPLTQTALAKYVVAESPVNAPGIEDIVKVATGAAGMGVNHVGVLYALLGVVIAANVGEVEQDAGSGDVWYEMVRQIAYLAYYQHPPSTRWHLPPGAFHPESLDKQATQKVWIDDPFPNPGMHVFTVVSRQDAKTALRDIGLQGEALKMGTAGSDSHFERFRKVYRGQLGGLPFPDKTGWVPTYDVPTDPRVSNDSADPNAITNQVAQDWANLADLRYALLLGFLEQYFLTKPQDRDFLREFAVSSDTTLGEMQYLNRLAKKLVTINRSPNAGGKAALPFTLPTPIHLPDQPALQWPVHIERMKAAIALVDKMINSHGAGNPTLKMMKDTDPLKLKKLQQMSSGGDTAPPPGGGPGTGHQSRLDRVREILNTATGTGHPTHGGAGRFWNLPRPAFLQTVVYGLKVLETTGENRGARSNLIKALKGEAPFDGTDFPRMPLGRPPVSPENIAFIQQWIDDGCPDDPM